MNRRALAILAAFTLAGCSTEEIEIDTGYRGAARRDPFLAAERFLEQQGYDVSVHMWLESELPPGGTLIVTGSSLGDRLVRDEVFKWVNAGGHLFVMLEGGEAFRNDFEPDTLKTATTPQDELLEELGIESVTHKSGTVTVSLGGSSTKIEMPSRFEWKSGRGPAKPDAIAEKDSKVALVSMRRGAGRITIAANAAPFRNRQIAEGDNAWLLSELIASGRQSEVWFLNSLRSSFFGMLWEHGWMAVVAAAVLLVVWLWKNIPRFGPLRSVAASGMRDFAGHIALTGAFLWRHRQRGPLIDPLRESVVRAAARRGFDRNDPGLPETLARFADMPPLRVRAALTGSNIDEPRSFVRAVQDLQQLHEKLAR